MPRPLRLPRSPNINNIVTHKVIYSNCHDFSAPLNLTDLTMAHLKFRH